MKKYWFKPKQFWKWFAAYYPVTKEGWIITTILGAILAAIFLFVDFQSRSLGETLYGIALPWIVIFLIFDII
mgnify:FL=1